MLKFMYNGNCDSTVSKNNFNKDEVNMELKDYEKVESTNIDFKEEVEYAKPKSWLKTVSAFANTNGGILLFGVRDEDKEPVGLKNVGSDTEKVSELINEKILQFLDLN